MRVRFPPDLRAASRARAVVSEYLVNAPSTTSADPDDVILAVSELVTNAVQAAAKKVELEVSVRDGALRVVVEDDAPGWPTRQSPDDHSERGRGLHIVAQLAVHWDVEKTDHGKKVVAVFGGRSAGAR